MRQPGQGQPMGSPPNQDRDPFGRDPENDGSGINPDGRDIKGPLTGDSTQDARRIRDELRRRAGERARPTPELNYIDRLLEQF